MHKRKVRYQIASDLAAMLLFSSDRTCCVCQIRGRLVQIHHIDGDPSHNEESNLAVLCFDCHRDTQIRGGFDRKLDAAQVVFYRDDWQRRVERRRASIEVPAGASTRPEVPSAEEDASLEEGGFISLEESGLEGLANLIRSSPERRRLAYQRAQPGWDTGVTADMEDASRRVIDALTAMLTELAAYFPSGHFDDKSPADFFAAEIERRTKWHLLQSQIWGEGQSGSINRIIVADHIISDLERMVEQMVASLTWMRSGFNYRSWLQSWQSAA